VLGPVPEDPLDHLRLIRLDRQLARDEAGVTGSHHAIPVTETTSRFAGLDSPAQAAVRFLCQFLEKQGIHRPLEADVQVRNVPFGERDDVDAFEGESLEQAGGIFLIAAETVQRFRKDDVKSLSQCVPHQGLNPWTQQRRSRHRVVRVFALDVPALTLGELATHTKLIGD
jgi:hypothetical protein